jgi:adenylate kinase
MKYYIIFGPPGAGKGTQSPLLTKRFELKHISTGELLREEIEKGTEIGIIAKNLIDKGMFVDDSIVLDMIRKEIFETDSSVKGFLFDGFPRTIYQAEEFDKMLRKYKNRSINAVLSLEIDDEIIVERITKRAEIEGRRDDSSQETIRARIATYHKKTEPLITYYKERGKYFPVKGDLRVDEIFANICQIMESIKNE